MSGHSYDRSCPNCDGNIDCYSDNRPFDQVSGVCYECGFYFYTIAKFYNLRDLNSCRAEQNEINEYDEGHEGYLPPLDALPERSNTLREYFIEPEDEEPVSPENPTIERESLADPLA